MGQDLIPLFVSEFTDSSSPFDNPACSPLKFARVQYLTYIVGFALMRSSMSAYSGPRWFTLTDRRNTALRERDGERCRMWITAFLVEFPYITDGVCFGF